MTITEIYNELKNHFLAVPGIDQLLDRQIEVFADKDPERTLMPEGDVPSAVRKGEYRVTALLSGAKGEAYTEDPLDFQGTLRQAVDIVPSEKGISAITISAMNAALSHLGLCPGTFPDDPAAHFDYADRLCRHVVSEYGRTNIVLVGYDGYIIRRFMEEGIDFWTMDRDPDNITKDRFHHVIVNSGRYNREACLAWGKLLIITGSSLCNGTIVQYLDQGKDLLFYGITASGTAALLGLPIFR